MSTEDDIPVIAVDGPSGSGKGTICRLLARELGWNLLDSGALYRLVGLAARNHGVRLDNHAALEVLAGHLDVQFRPGDDADEARVILEGEDVSLLLRSEEVGALASEVAALPGVRASLLRRERRHQAKFHPLLPEGPNEVAERAHIRGRLRRGTPLERTRR